MIEKDIVSLIILIDHENIPFNKISLKKIISLWIDCISDTLPRSSILNVKIRAYGGWYSGSTVTDTRFKAAEFYQQHCPMVFLYSNYVVRTTFEFADQIIGLKNHKDFGELILITNTVVSRSSKLYSNYSPLKPLCSEPGCEIDKVRRWIRRNSACTKSGCPHKFSEFFLRKEQKQVDVHIAVDLLNLISMRENIAHIALASDDLDIVPAIVASATKLQGPATLTAIRVERKETYLDELIRKLRVNIVKG